MVVRVVVVLAVLVGCKARTAAPAEPHCFTIAAGTNSATTTALFTERKLQGGGYTWDGIMGTVAAKLATLGDDLEQTPDMPGHGGAREALFRGTHTWFLTDAEGDAAVICAGTSTFLDALRAEYDHLQADPKALEAALAAVPADEAE